MKRSTRWIGLVWLALVLNVLSPVIGYACRMAAQRPITLELCGAPGSYPAAADLDHGDDAPRQHAFVPHCVYCSGFTANFALGGSLPVLPDATLPVSFARAVAPPVVFVRRIARVAQPRAPPETALI
ncbi:DUF2946 domain-containing protein [Trinickia violacea]|uniref:DUF2946 domain-containing protein n=1 Tax=Trinickia violacea TaxID=2571746 RepID=A0A4P8IR51_9BURK|nr:DUF2946 domain-containing protein [Trinickia violacea]QCP50621.1 DUF2946 domain-containing protein [Trinickia violacea]